MPSSNQQSHQYDRLKIMVRAIDAFKVCCEVDPPARLIQIFCFVAANDGCLQADMQEVTGLSESSCSRMIKWLGDWKSDDTRGLGLIRAEVDPVYWRRKKLYLTSPKGTRLADLIQTQLEV